MQKFEKLFNDALKVAQSKNLTQEQKEKFIRETYGEYSKELDDELKKYLAKKYTGATIEIGSAALPVSGAGRIGAQLAGKVFTKTLGRRLAQDLGAGAASGLASGGVYGIGRGLMEDKNPLATSAQDALTGLMAGSALGLGSSYTEKLIRAKQLENSNLTNATSSTEIKKIRHQGKQYYKDYLQHRSIETPFAINVNFPGSQAGEIGLHNYKMLPKIPAQIKNANAIKMSNDKPERLDALNFIKLYNNNKGKNYEYIIRNNSNKTGNDFYQIKEVGSTPAYSDQPRALGIEPTTIIPNSAKNLNPPEVIIPASIISASEMNQTPDNKNGSGVLKGNVEINADTNGVPIFTREDISNMTLDEYAKNEKSIMEQLNSFGIPTQTELDYNISNNSGEVYVKSYTRSDGTKVNGYYRSR